MERLVNPPFLLKKNCSMKCCNMVLFYLTVLLFMHSVAQRVTEKSSQNFAVGAGIASIYMSQLVFPPA